MPDYTVWQVPRFTVSWHVGDSEEPKFQSVSKGKKKASIPVQRHSGRENRPLLQGGSALFFKSKLQLID